MILQMLLTIVFGFGVLTWATVALSNAAGQKLHHGAQEGLLFRFRYLSDDAERLRSWFAWLPVWLGWAASVAVVSTGALYVWASPQPQLPPGEPDASHLSPASIIAWVGMALYVLALVVVTTWLSRRHYTVMQDVDRV